MRNRSLSPRTFGRFLNVLLCGGALLSCCHIFSDLSAPWILRAANRAISQRLRLRVR
jgi:hypothetical protein